MVFWPCVDFTSGRLLFNVLWTGWVCLCCSFLKPTAPCAPVLDEEPHDTRSVVCVHCGCFGDWSVRRIISARNEGRASRSPTVLRHLDLSFPQSCRPRQTCSEERAATIAFSVARVFAPPGSQDGDQEENGDRQVSESSKDNGPQRRRDSFGERGERK